MIDRTALRQAFRMDEGACVVERLRQAAPASAVHVEAAALAAKLIEGARERKAAGLDAFLQSYGLATEEGIALMCLAEALLRVPDTETADALIHDKLAGIDWSEHLGESSSTFVNAATFSLMLTGEVLRGGTKPDAAGRAIPSRSQPRSGMSRRRCPVARPETSWQSTGMLGCKRDVYSPTLPQKVESAYGT